MSSVASEQSTQQLLSFVISPNSTMLLPTSDLTEVLTVSVSQIVPIPECDRSVMGVCNWRGEVLWLVDLASMLGEEPLFQHRPVPSHYSVIIVHYTMGQQKTLTLGLVVTQVAQMLWCDRAAIQAVPASPAISATADFLQGYWLSPQGETCWILNSQAILNAFQPQ
jgi:positive phototaxis protein PixI